MYFYEVSENAKTEYHVRMCFDCVCACVRACVRVCYRELLDVKVLGQVLCLSHSVLLNDPCQLASQLLGRLERIISQDKPVTSGTHTNISTSTYCTYIYKNVKHEVISLCMCCFRWPKTILFSAWSVGTVQELFSTSSHALLHLPASSRWTRTHTPVRYMYWISGHLLEGSVSQHHHSVSDFGLVSVQVLILRLVNNVF